MFVENNMDKTTCFGVAIVHDYESTSWPQEHAIPSKGPKMDPGMFHLLLQL